ncbi:MAG: glycosyltransferase family 2 protein [Deltaproteobacteria bacterium]|nr:glycosyltransferase family 2 protein [Deltaproteobacteria bacterium]
MNKIKPGYIIICPVRNEENFLSAAIESIAGQSIQPAEYILVDDGSTDRTFDIIKEAAEKYSWIHYVQRTDRGERKVGPGVVEAFYAGYQAIRSKKYDYICKMDGDLTVGPLYFETLFDKFKQDPYLGAASGKLYLDMSDGKLIEERISDESVLGGVLCISRRCFEAIGGFVQQVMWDGITFHRCRMEGFRTCSFKDRDLMIYDHRLMGSSHKSVFHGRIRWGWGQYFMGTHPLYILAIGAYRMLEHPFVIGGILIVLGYLKGWIIKTPRYDYPGFRKSLHAWQLERLRIGKRLENIPDIP